MPATVTVDGEVLRVRLTGASVVWAFRRKLDVPLAHVAHARVEPRRVAQRQRPVMRAPGTWLPRTITAGTYRGRPGRRGKQLWEVRRGARVLVVDLRDDGYACWWWCSPTPRAR